MNKIHATAKYGPNVVLGQYNEIGERVVIDGRVTIGDCCRIEADTRILAGDGEISIGDWGVIHNHCFLGIGGRLSIGHNVWLGEMTLLDSRGGLRLGHGVRIGTMGHVWTHIAAAEQIEGGLYGMLETVIEDDVWLVGDNVTVNPGVHVAARSVALPHSVLTRHTRPGATYAGAPAKEVGIPFWKEVTHEDKLRMMTEWTKEFAQLVDAKVRLDPGLITIECDGDALVIGYNLTPDLHATLFDLETKRYTKRLTILEREFYRFIYGNKARFIPAP